MDEEWIAGQVGRITAGWKTLPGYRPDSLAKARQALAAGLALGKTPADLHSALSLLTPNVPDVPATDEIRQILGTPDRARPSEIGVVRSLLAASAQNPDGTPPWARGMQVQQTHGPFVDAQGALHFVDIIPLTVASQFAFGDAAQIFASFPIHVFAPHPPTQLALGAGSVWFSASLLVPSLPAGTLTGFRVGGGTLDFSAPAQVINGVHVFPASATVTLTANLAPPAPVPPGGKSGADATAGVEQMPVAVTIAFTQSGATVQTLDASQATVYGSSFGLTWNGQAPLVLDGNTRILVPCAPDVTSFEFANVQSTLFTPSGTAAVVGGGWALPVATTTFSALGEASGAGTLLLGLGTGAAASWQAHPAPASVIGWQIEAAPNSLSALAGGQGPAALTTFSLWPQPAPLPPRATVDFRTPPAFLVSFSATPGVETLFSPGQATAHLDKPIAANGTRFALQAPASLSVRQDSGGTTAAIVANGGSQAEAEVVPLALENALLGVHPPRAFFVVGPLDGASFTRCSAVLFFDARWLLPTLPDPYAANFLLDAVRAGGLEGIGPISALVSWAGAADAPLSFFSSPQGILPGQANALTNSRIGGGLALLDLSTRVDQFGVALRSTQGRDQGGAQAGAPAPPTGLSGLTLAVNGALAATFALPQVSWEPMESLATPSGPIFSDPAFDGPPLLLQSPNEQQLVPFAPEPVLLQTIENVAGGLSFAAQFSLPFGLIAHIQQPNRPLKSQGIQSLFLSDGGEFHLTQPEFPASLSGGRQLTLKPRFPDSPDPQFGGETVVDTHGVAPGYGHAVLGDSAATIFTNEFTVGGANPGVPLKRIDLAGYGASIWSEWADTTSPPPSVTKVQFQTIVGRTAYEVIQVATVLMPFHVLLVRTVTMQRQGAGWVQRADSGWQPASPGLFQFDSATDLAGRVHRGAVAGVYNVRNIRETGAPFFVPATATQPPFEYKEVRFDADVGLTHNVRVVSGGKATSLLDAAGNPVTLVPARDLVGYVQLGPDEQSPEAASLAGLFGRTGPLSYPFSCAVEIGALGSQPGTTLRCSVFEVDMPLATSGPDPAPALAVALRGAPQLPRDGAWGVGRRAANAPAPAPLGGDFPLPLVQPSSDPATWHFADIADVLRLDQPAHFYGLLQDTGTQKLLFEQPTVPASPPAVPGIQLPNPPNFADLAALLNATGLFPDLSSTISLLTSGIQEQLDTLADGLKYSKTFAFDAKKPPLPLLDLGVLQVALSYADESKGRDGGGSALAPTVLSYTLDPTKTPRWALSVKPLTFLVTLPEFGSDPLLMIVGSFAGDAQTTPTLTDMTIVYGSALDTLKSIFSRLQALAQFLPGGAGAELEIALSDGKLTVTDTFAIPTLPLGLGELSDISLDLGLALQLSPLAASFRVGIGEPDKPFNWIVSPLAGNGLIDIGVKDNKPELTVQAGIGLGLAIDVAIASGSASITIAVRLDVTGSTITLMAILTGQASVDVLDGLVSASLTLTAAVGFSVNPLPIPVPILAPPGIKFPAEDVSLLASVSVGIHISVCWVVSVDWDGSWQFSQSIHTPEIDVNL